ncbi:hypothetical protein [Paraburkholderia lacunae]|uniref:Uncharacterized protein n=1 Tax=Paraburkholderia lacunae TaxID=2211104 RepID=A0A370N1Z9_9BURK|nr:hypothetical protein [Paraburkholderia lacunae]RDJ99645.1 hypothetical protein DLM46_27420 [Paraburkholderia lacunae]
MLPLLSLHALAAQRGDGLRPELLALLERHRASETGLTVPIEAPEVAPPDDVVDGVADDPATAISPWCYADAGA